MKPSIASEWLLHYIYIVMSLWSNIVKVIDTWLFSSPSHFVDHLLQSLQLNLTFLSSFMRRISLGYWRSWHSTSAWHLQLLICFCHFASSPRPCYPLTCISRLSVTSVDFIWFYSSYPPCGYSKFLFSLCVTEISAASSWFLLLVCIVFKTSAFFPCLIHGNIIILL